MLTQAQWEELIQTGIALSSYKELDALLKRIAQDSIKIVGCEGASIYIKNGEQLDFMVTRNTVLEERLGNLDLIFKAFTVPITNESIAGYVAGSGELLNLADVYALSDKKPYKFYDTFDKKHAYQTKSMLTLPMKDNNNELVGILQLLNSRDEKGALADFSGKDIFIARYLASIAGMAIKNTSVNEVLKKSYYETVERLALASEFRDLETSYHIKRISEYAVVLWKKVGKGEDIDNVRYASQMHDIGKIGIPDRILQKPGPLTEEERQIMNQHALIGAKILEGSSSPLLRLSRIVALTHHEKWDGSGYPYGLKGEEIPLIGRIVAMVDVFDALTSKRVYKPAFSIDSVLKTLDKEKGIHFDPKLVDVFFQSMPDILNIYNRYKE